MVDSPELMAELEWALPEVLDGEVTETERNSARTFLQQYQDVFALKSTDLGRTNLVEHEIEVGTNRPIKLPPRRIPIHTVETVVSALSEMKEKGIICLGGVLLVFKLGLGLRLLASSCG